MTAPAVPVSPVPSPTAARPPRRRFLRSLVPYVVVAALTVLVLLRYFPPWHVDWQTPFIYGGDGFQHMVYTKGFVENGWYLHNPSLGAPGEMDLREFPAGDALPGLIIKCLGLFTHKPGFINNLLFLLSFPLASVAACFACRRMGVSAGPAGLAGVLYAFLPYHFWRSTGHLYLSCYFMVPLAALVAWWVATGRLFDRADGGGPGRCVLAAAICAVTSTAGLYYPFFAGVVLAAASLVALCGRRDRRHFLVGSALTLLLAAGMLLCLLPTLLFLHAHPHPPVSQRALGESELYGLKLVQLILPSDSHPLTAFRRVTSNYDRLAPLVTENSTATLGVLGALGCLGLLGWLLFRPLVRAPADPAPPPPGSAPPLREILDVLGVLNGTALLYGTVGGLGTLFAVFVSPQLRSLNRISVFIAFFSLAAVAACLDRWFVRPGRPRAARAAGWAALAGLLTLGLLDETPRRVDLPSFRRTTEEYRTDLRFFTRVQAAVPAGTMIFELPYAAFPETRSSVGTMDIDSHFRGYLQTEGLRWSYGAIRNSRADLWQQRIAALPLADGVRDLALAGFGGILLERSGYEDRGVAAEAVLRQSLGPPVAQRQERLFFDMADYDRTLRASMTAAQWDEASGRVRHLVFARFGLGFTGPETKDGHSWYWGGPEGAVTILNDDAAPRSVRLTMQAQTGRDAPARLTLTGAGASQTWTINRTLQPITAVLEVPPGGAEVRFTCDGLPIDAPGEPRVMVWSPVDVRIEEAAPSPSPLPPANPDAAGQGH